LIAPERIIAEVANAGWKAVRSGGMTSEQHDHTTSRPAVVFDTLFPLGPLAPHASHANWIIARMNASTSRWLKRGEPRWWPPIGGC
jgi:hypothetical protein